MKCCKRKFHIYSEAGEAISEIKVLNMSKGQIKKNNNLHVYRCYECHAFHVGHSTPQKFRDSPDKKPAKGPRIHKNMRKRHNITSRDKEQ